MVIKSYKLSSGKYWGSTGIVHRKKRLDAILDEFDDFMDKSEVREVLIDGNAEAGQYVKAYVYKDFAIISIYGYKKNVPTNRGWSGYVELPFNVKEAVFGPIYDNTTQNLALVQVYDQKYMRFKTLANTTGEIEFRGSVVVPVEN